MRESYERFITGDDSCRSARWWLCRFSTIALAVACAAGAACSTAGTAGAPCTASGDCESELQCIYAIGAGCGAKGQCGTLSGSCLAGSENLILCACAGASIDVSCISASAALLQPTATGAACATDGGPDGGDVE